MHLEITQETINEQAATLELAKMDIINKAVLDLNIKDLPSNIVELRCKLEKYFFAENRCAIFEKVRRTVAKLQNIEEEQIETFIQHFIIDPILDDNYQLTLAMVKKKVTEQFIPKFPITTVVLDKNSTHLYNLGTDEPVAINILKTLETYDPHINVVSTFDSIITLITAGVNCFEDKIERSTKNKEMHKIWSQEISYVVSVLDQNCVMLLEICTGILKTIVRNYSFDKLKSVDELKHLIEDFTEYCRKVIVADSRKLGKYSPKTLIKRINDLSSDSWNEVEKKMKESLKIAKKEKMMMSFASSKKFKKSFKDLYHAVLEQHLFSSFGIVPKIDVFLHESSSKVNNRIEQETNHNFSEILFKESQGSIECREHLNTLLSQMLDPSSTTVHGFFLASSDLDPDSILSHDMRRNFGILILAVNPKIFIEEDYLQHMTMCLKMLEILGVHKDPMVIQTLSWCKTKGKRAENKSNLHDVLQQITAQLDKDERLKFKVIQYLIVGLYFLFMDAEKDLNSIRKAIASHELILLKQSNFKKRQFFIKFLRHLRNGFFMLLNYQLLIMLEGLLENFRHSHNKYVSKVLRKQEITAEYNLDYQEVVAKFSSMPIYQLSLLIHQAKTNELIRSSDLFVSSFISDLQFSPVEKMIEANTSMFQVDESQSLRTSTLSPVKPPKQIFTSVLVPRKKYSFTEMDIDLQKKQDELKLHGKLKYLREKVTKFEIQDLHPKKLTRSRCPIVCLSGFLSEDDDRQQEFKHILDINPYTEVLTINWRSFSHYEALKQGYKALTKVSFVPLAKTLYYGIKDVLKEKIPGGQSDSKEKMKKLQVFNEDDSIANELDYYEANKSMEPENRALGFPGNPFQYAEIPEPETSAEEEKPKAGFFAGLPGFSDIKNIFSKETLKTVTIS